MNGSAPSTLAAPSTHAAHDGQPAGRRFGMPHATRRFVRHYLEMVAAMFLGMIVLGMPAGWALGAVGSSLAELESDAPSVMLLGMAVTMTVPMVAWMRYRGHGLRTSTEMAASMLVPTFAAIALVEAGAMKDIDAVLLAEHIAMLLGMLVAMLLRPAEYAHHHERHAELRPATA